MSPTKPKTAWIAAVPLALLVGLAISGCGADGSEEAKGQTVRFQKPTEPGPKPFTKPADVAGPKKVSVGSGPFGGTGSDLVCDRELLIRSLRAQPEKMREWARTVGISPSISEVERYIRELTPVTLTRDTRVTNHNFAGGRAVGYQAILQAGTAVLVDNDGFPRARCRCGNPLLEPVFIPEATCYGCPKGYTPPEPCEPFEQCYEPYPDPPPVTEAAADADHDDAAAADDHRRDPARPPTLVQPPPGTTTSGTHALGHLSRRPRPFSTADACPNATTQGQLRELHRARRQRPVRIQRPGVLRAATLVRHWRRGPGSEP